jgi:uncharacterized protein (DUF1697 family)
VPAYIAILRGINVAGHNPIRMKQLRDLCNLLGFQSVETYVQSGNIVFQTKMENPSVLSKRINERLLQSSGFNAPVVVRTRGEMQSVIANNPFVKERGVDPSKLHVTFLSETPKKGSRKRLEALATSPDRFHAAPREIYLYCPNGYGRTQISNTAIEKALSVTATTRNWNTTKTLAEMVSKFSA